MNLVPDYSSDSENGELKTSSISQKQQYQPSSILVNPVPEVANSAIIQQEYSSELQKQSYRNNDIESARNTVTGKVEKWNMDNFTFDEQYHNFARYGFAADPNAGRNSLVFGNHANLGQSNSTKESGQQEERSQKQFNPTDYLSKSVYGLHRHQEKEYKKNMNKRRKKSGAAASGQFLGPWAGYNDDGVVEEIEKEQNEEDAEEIKSHKSQEQVDEGEEEKSQTDEKENNSKQKKKFQKVINNSSNDFKEGGGQTVENILKSEDSKDSTFHGEALFDYKGRSYLEPPTELKPKDHTCYIPKKSIYEYRGHTKEVSVVRFFPKFGHFVLSGSFDTQIKLWDVYNNKKCIRTYMGHNEGVRDIFFTNNGKHFLSAGYDRTINYWDTETGKIIKSFSVKGYPYCVRFHPDDDKQHSFLCASSNKKIAQYDTRTGNRTQQYDEHLKPVNTVTFFDSGRKFVSTSDDKKILVWEFGIPVVTKHISDPDLHAITYATMHPSGKHYAGQSSDNKISVYDTKNGGFKTNRNKKFDDHENAGYAINLGFSPDGQYLATGDSQGRVFFYDWKKTKALRIFNAHEKVTMGIDWHPIDASKVITCSWDGTMKLWD